MPPAAQTSEAAILASLVGWSAESPPWQRDALRRLGANETLSEGDTDALLSICKGEAAANPLSADHVRDPAAANSVITLRRLHDVQHVNALALDAEMSFDRAGLTVIYGDNGSGKSGYARILKNACRARVTGRENILANIYEANPGDPSAIIDFTVNGQNRTAPWEFGKPADPMLSAVSVFDARTANIHVDQANDVAYTPAPLRMLAALAQACQTVRQRLNAEVAQLQKQIPDAIRNPSCQPDTAVGKLLANLGARGATEAVERLATLSEAERERLIQLTVDLAADPARVSRQLATLKAKLEGYILRLENLERAVSDETARDLRNKALAHAAARAGADAASTTLFAHEPLPHVGSDIWRDLWESARRYSEQEAYAGETFPVVEPASVCVLCQQDLVPEAAARLSRFEAFIKDDSKRREGEAKTAYDEALGTFQAAQISADEAAIIVTCITDELPDGGLAASLGEALQHQLERFDQIGRDHAAEPTPAYADIAPLPLEALRTHVADLGKRAAGLSTEAGSEARKSLIAERNELADRQWLRTINADAVAQIERLKKISRLQAAAQDTGTTRITAKSTEVAETLVTNALRAQFAREVDRLGVASLAIELKRERSAYGIPRFKVALTRKPAASVGDVLSEGEHRSVALAAFLAELATTDAKSAIVFDDPISSLDHMHREAVAKRLVDEALHRQVIVFTHDIAFLFLLDQARDELDPAPHFAIRSVSRGRDYAGFCNPEPPFKARPLTDIVRGMASRLGNEKINFERGNQPEWEKTVSSLQEQLRESWERAVEEALSPVLKRLSNKVATGGLSKVTAITLADCETMRAAFGRCSVLLHSEAAGLNTPLPTPEVVEAEIVALEEWVNSIRDRQRAIDPI